MQIGAILGWKFPDGGFLVRDDSDGKGPYIAEWTRTSSQPTVEELAAWQAEMNSEPSIAEVRAAKQSEIRDKADLFLAALASEYGAMEKLTWDQQAAESDALASNPDAPAPLVRSIATARSMDPLELVARIRANRAQWVLLSGAIVGQRLAYQDALDAAQTVEEVEAIVPVFP